MSNTIIYDGNEVINNHAICNFQHDKSRRSRRELILGGAAPPAPTCVLMIFIYVTVMRA